MLSSARKAVRPLLIGGSVAICLSLFGSLISGDLANWWWHIGTIGSAVGIGIGVHSLRANHQELAVRVFASITLTIVFVAAIVYLAANIGFINLQRVDSLTGGRNAIAAGVALNTLSIMLLLPKRQRFIGLVGLLTLFLIGNIPILIFSLLVFFVLFWSPITASDSPRPGALKWLFLIILAGGIITYIALLCAASVGTLSWGTNVPQLSSSERLQAYGVAIEGFLERPFAGNGLQSFPEYYRTKFPTQQPVDHPHSSVLLVLFEQGIIGALSVFFLITGTFLSKYPLGKRIVVMAGFVAVLSMFDSVFFHALIFYPFWISINLLPRTQRSQVDAQSFLGGVVDSGIQHRLLKRIHAIADISILGLGVIVILRFVAITTEPVLIEKLIIILVLVATWIVFRLVPRALPGTQQFGFEVAFFPISATAVLAIVLAIIGTSFVLSDLVVFYLILQIGIGTSRLVLRQMVPKVDILLLGESAYFDELRLDPALTVHISHVEGAMYDYVVLGSQVEAAATASEHFTGSGRYVVTDLQAVELFHGRIPPESLQGQWEEAMKLRTRRYLPLKRVIETGAILLLSPFILLLTGVVATIVLLSSGRPVIFSQTRVGRNNTPFQIYKFRTMRADAEAGGAKFAGSDDTRITPIGRVLRGFRLDEIPQFWNVLTGDMSIIGPRPEQEVFAEEFAKELPAYSARHIVRPGITGWAQVNHGYAAGKDETLEKLTYDLFYIQHFSLWLDLHIAGKTITTILTRFGAK